MDRKRALHWAGILGLLTALVTLITVGITFVQKADEGRERAQEAQRQAEQQAERDRANFEAQRQRDQEEMQRQLELQRETVATQQAAQQHADLCNEHATRRAAIEARFSDLMERHGTLMNAIRGCSHERSDEDKRSCMTTICVGAALWTNGESNCIEVVADGAALRQDIERENGATQTDGCPVPVSAITEFFR